MPPAKPVIHTTATGDTTRRLLSAASVPYLLVAAGVIAAVVLLGVEIDHHVSAIETWLDALGPWNLVAVSYLLAAAGVGFRHYMVALMLIAHAARAAFIQAAAQR